MYSKLKPYWYYNIVLTITWDLVKIAEEFVCSHIVITWIYKRYNLIHNFRCLNPGKYALHIEHWLDYFHHNNLHIIDGDQLKSNPVDVLDQFQKFLKITPMFDYSSHIRYFACCLLNIYVLFHYIMLTLL